MKKIMIFAVNVVIFLPAFAQAAFPLYLELGKCKTEKAIEPITFTVFVDMKCIMKKTDCEGAILLQVNDRPGALGLNTRVSSEDGGANIEVIMMNGSSQPGISLKFNTETYLGKVETSEGLRDNVRCKPRN